VSKPLHNRILLVEDEALLGMSEKMQLEKYGYAVRIVSSGEQAIEAVRSSSDIDLILMDINLGNGIDGTQAAEIILRDHDIPVVFLSSHTDPEVVEKTEKITSYGYVVKNSNVTVLDASIKMAFKLFDAKIAAQQNAESLRRSEEKYRLQFMHMTSYNSMYEVVRNAEGNPCDFRFLMVNRAYEEFVGKDASELVGKTLLEAFPRTERYWIDRMCDVVVTGKPLTYENYSTELDTFIEINLFVPQEGQLVMTSTNVTERKRMERDLKESVSRYQELVAQIPIGVYVVWLRADGRKEFEYVSDRWCAIHGVSRDRVLADSSTVDNLVHPDDVERFVECHRDSAHRRKPFRWEGRFVHGDGDIRWVRIESTPHFLENGDIRWFGITQDITDRTQIEEAFARKMELLEASQVLARLGSFEWDMDDDVWRFSDQWKSMHGFSGGDLTTEQLLEIAHPDDAPGIRRALSDAREYGTPYDIEHRIVIGNTPDVRYVRALGEAGFDQKTGRPVRMTGAVQDITEHKQIEQDLTSQKQFLETILATTPDGFWVVDPEKKITDVNTAYSAMSGYSTDELTRMAINDLDALESPEETAARMQRIMENGFETFETKHRRKDGTVFDVEVSASRVNQADSDYLVAFCRDISERKATEEALRKSEEELKKAQEITHIGSWYLDIETNHVTWTDELYKMYGFDPAKPVPPYTEHMKLFTPESWNLLSTSLATTRDTGIPYELELQTVRHDGSNGWMWVRGEAVFDEDRRIIGLWGAAQDITDRKQVEHEVRKQLSEKETLLREVHHRVKNNITTIESLLSLQIGDSVSAEVTAALQETISRVQSIRVLYEKLLISDELNAISMKDYVESLLDALVMVFDPGRTITAETHIADIDVASETAISIGIIINELLTNAFKYAFPGRDGGSIAVAIEERDTTVSLTIRDNGVGIDETIMEQPSPGFGLTIVSMLAEQLGGTLRFTNDDDTLVTLEFPIGSGEAELTAAT